MQFLAQEHEIMEAVTRVMNSDSYILGSEVSSFEEEFATYVGVAECIGVNSGTDSIILGLKALGITRGDEVITPSHTAVATVAAIMASGATPVFADIDPISFTLNPNSVQEAITPNTKAIIAVHLYGHPCDMDSLAQIASKNGVFLIEDCSQAHGAKWRNRKVGSFGVLACFSFYPTKNLGAIGDGGAVVTNNLDIANSIRRLRQYGWDSQKQAQVQSSVSRLDELQAAILRIKLINLDLANAKRRKIAENYSARLINTNLILPTVGSNAEHVFHLYVAQVENREKIIDKLNKLDIFPGIHYQSPVHLQPAYRSLESSRKTSLRVTESIQSTILSLPMYPELTETDINRVCEGVLNV
jgi:dTDP-4-amino-4,6-dideoxygalactose transaminase